MICRIVVALSLLVAAGSARAQPPANVAMQPVPPGAYDPKVAFAPLTLPGSVNRYRSGDGAPGPDYWQNRVDYDIKARIDVPSKVLAATELITYTNHSPNPLPSLWVQLDQNIYRQDSRAAVGGGWSAGA